VAAVSTCWVTRKEPRKQENDETTRTTSEEQPPMRYIFKIDNPTPRQNPKQGPPTSNSKKVLRK
jgi:hypothetical protein